MNRQFFLCLLIGLLHLTACIPASESPAPPTQTNTAVSTTPPILGYTNQQPDGNRFIAGKGEMPAIQPLDIELGAKPVWITAVPYDDGVIWGILLENNLTQAFLVKDGNAQPVSLAPSVLVDTAPLLMVNELDEVQFVAPLTNIPGGNHPVRLNDENDHAFSNAKGELFLLDGRGHDLGQPDVDILPDGRLLVDENGRLLVLTNPSDSYDHGVLGDELEASGMVIINPRPEPAIISQINIPAPQLIEGIAPIWVDWDGDGQREIVATLSDRLQGAQIVLFAEDGTQLASGAPIGQGFRWRHQIAVAPLGPAGEIELVSVRTPHIGGIVEFYQWQDDELKIVAELPGFTSHVIGSRNLDMGAVGDFDGDGRIATLLPTQDRANLGAIYRTEDGAEVAWTVPLPAKLNSNIGAATLENGQMAVGVGLDNNILRIWQPANP